MYLSPCLWHPADQGAGEGGSLYARGSEMIGSPGLHVYPL